MAADAVMKRLEENETYKLIKEDKHERVDGVIHESTWQLRMQQVTETPRKRLVQTEELIQMQTIHQYNPDESLRLKSGKMHFEERRKTSMLETREEIRRIVTKEEIRGVAEAERKPAEAKAPQVDEDGDAHMQIDEREAEETEAERSQRKKLLIEYTKTTITKEQKVQVQRHLRNKILERKNPGFREIQHRLMNHD